MTSELLLCRNGVQHGIGKSGRPVTCGTKHQAVPPSPILPRCTSPNKPADLGYVIKAFVAKLGLLEVMSAQYSAAHVISLRQGMGLVPMTEALFDEINLSELSEDLPGFVLMTIGVEKQILKLYPVGEIAFVEADYFGGHGSQSAVVWSNGRRSEIYPNIQNAINFALKRLGISRENVRDEFEELNLGRHRDTHDWV